MLYNLLPAEIILTKILKHFCVLVFSFFILENTSAQKKSTREILYDSAKESLARNEYSKAIDWFNKCLPIAQKDKDSFLLGNTYVGIGIAYDRTGNYENALQNYFTALHWYESIDNKKKIGGTLKNIGNIYRVLKTYEKSFSFLNQALHEFDVIKDSTGASNVLNDIGILNMELDSNYKAIRYFKLVTDKYIKYVKPEVLPYVLNNLGFTMVRVGQINNASVYYQASLDSMQKRNDRYGIALLYGNLSELALKQHNPDKSLLYSKQGLDIAAQLNSKDLLAGAYKNMAVSYSALDNDKEANRFLLMYSNLKDTFFKEESAKKYAEMETKYQTEKKQTQISLLQKENIIKNTEITNQKLTRNFLLAGLALILIIALIIYKNYHAKQKINQELNYLNTKLDEANKAKTKLLGIISHDLRTPVSSLLSLLNLRRNNPKRFTEEEQDKYDKQIAASAGSTLEVMSDLLIWSKSQMESFTPYYEEIYMYDCFQEIIQLNALAASEKNIALINESPGTLTLCTDPNFLRIILRNLVSNAVKFTPQHGIIHLAGCRQQNNVQLSVKDNGPGMQPGQIETIFDWNSIRSDSSGLGLKLAKEFAENLQASIKVVSEINMGTEFILTFPVRSA